MSIPEQGTQQYVAPQAPAPTNFFEALSQGLQQSKFQQQQNARADQDRQALLLQRQQIQQKQAMDLAGNQNTMLGQQLLNTPGAETNPDYVNKVKEIYKTLGLPAPITKTPDGKEVINKDAYKAPADQAELDRIRSLPVGTARSSALDAYAQTHSGITPAMYTADVAMTPKDIAAIGKMNALVTHDKNLDTLAAERTRNVSILDAAKTGMITQETKNLVTKNAEIQANIQRTLAQAASIPQRTQIMQQNANTMLQRTQAMIQNKSISHSSVNMAQGQIRQMSSEYHRDLDLVNNLAKQQAALVNGGTSTDDPAYQALDTQIQEINKSVVTLKPAMDKLDDFYHQNFASIITSANMSAATGRPVDVVPQGKSLGDAPPGTPEGATNKMNGRDVIVHNGKIYYK